MRVFVDFEASSLGRHGFPIEVAWVFEDGTAESHLIRPAPGWEDWDPKAEAIHGIARATLDAEGEAHDAVARAMVAALCGHALYASAPSWDGKWLSLLLRAAGLPRHALRLADTDAALAESARAILADAVPAEALDRAVRTVLTLAEVRFRPGPPRHRAQADAESERQRWRALVALAHEQAAEQAARCGAERAAGA